MLGVGAIAEQMWVSARPFSITTCNSNSNSNSMSSSSTNPYGLLHNSLSFPCSPKFSLRQRNGARTNFAPRVDASSSSGYMEEPVTKVIFQTSFVFGGLLKLVVFACQLLVTGRKNCGVKVYAAGLYIDEI